MKTYTSNTAKTISANEQQTGESKNFTLTVRSKSGTVLYNGPLIPPEPPPEPTVPDVESIAVTPSSVTTKVGDSAPVSWRLLDANGVPITDPKPATFASANPAVATFDGSVVRGVGVGSTTVSISCEDVVTSIPVMVAAAVVIPPTPSALFDQILGPLPTLAALEAKGGAFLKHVSDWRSGGDSRTAIDGTYWEASNYYDRSQHFYALWKITGDVKWRDRANAIALSYRKRLEDMAAPYQYNESTYWSMPSGLALHYAATGDVASQRAVGYTAEWMTSKSKTDDISGVGVCGMRYVDATGVVTYRMADAAGVQHIVTPPWAGQMIGVAENRQRARLLEIVTLAHIINAPHGGPATGGGVILAQGSWAEQAAMLLGIIKQRYSSATGTWHDGEQWGYQKPFMDALLLTALIRYNETFTPDPWIVTTAKACCDRMWAKCWSAGSGGAPPTFKYQEAISHAPTGSGGPEAAPDLNAMMSHPFAWVAKQAGATAVEVDRARQVFEAGVYGAYLNGTKQYNQAFTSSFRALTLLG
jgi:hypothetical protein